MDNHITCVHSDCYAAAGSFCHCSEEMYGEGIGSTGQFPECGGNDCRDAGQYGRRLHGAGSSEIF